MQGGFLMEQGRVDVDSLFQQPRQQPQPARIRHQTPYEGAEGYIYLEQAP